MSTDVDVWRVLDRAVTRFSLDQRDLQEAIAQIWSAMQEIERHAGGSTASETFAHRFPTGMLHLVRPIARVLTAESPPSEVWGITSISERWSGTWSTLSALDYEVLDRWRIVRSGPCVTWGEAVTIIYTPEIDRHLRDKVTLDLVALDRGFSAARRESLPDYSVDFGGAGDHASRRRDVLAQLREAASAMVI